ncbi:type II secretion system F family protein [Salinisphaera aquimarina]|uniref:Type II secretion system F family protein n=1 Tax=Salinisphaera aquimarina TaxID=2094031 RepID=A0ABV7ET84_9GAMM
MNTTALFVALMVGMGVVGLGLLLLTLIVGVREARVRRRYHGERGREDNSGQRGRDAWVAGMAQGGERIDQLLKGADETRMLLAQAGWRDARSRAVFYAVQLALPVIAAMLGLFVFGGLGLLEGALRTLLFTAVVVILALLAPRYVLRSKARKRRDRIRAEVPLFINLLVLLFEAGLNLRQALTSLVRDGSATMPVLVEELAPLLRQIEAGADADQLLFEAGKMLAIDELDTVLGILRQVERYGGEIREPLLEALENLQSKRSMELREQVNVMSGKMTVVLVTCFFPPLLIFIAGPAFMSIAATLGNL